MALLLTGAIAIGACDCGPEPQTGGELIVAPLLVDFGEVSVDLAGRKSVLLGNKGPGRLTILEAVVLGELAKEVRLDAVPAAIAGGGTFDLPLVFTPKVAGTRDGSMVIRTDSSITPEVTIRLIGVAVDPGLIVEPDELDLGRVIVGDTRTASVVVTNVGKEPVLIRSVTGDVDTSPELTAALGGIRSLDPNESFSFAIIYRPVDTGFDEGRFVVADDTGAPMRAGVRVRAEGSISELAVDPEGIAFNGVFAGEIRRRFFDLRNLGAREQTIERIAIEDVNGDGELSVVTSTSIATPFTLRSGEGRRVFVEYAPQNAGTDVATISIQSTAIGGDRFVFLSGNGVLPPYADLVIEPLHLDFGPVEVGTSRARRVIVGNNGTLDLYLLSVAFEPADAPFTTLDAPPPLTVFSALDEHTFSVVATPQALGPLAPVSLVLQTDDPMSPTATISISLEGVGEAVPDFEVDRGPLVFGPVPRGSEARRVLLIESTGSAPLTLEGARWLDDAGGLFSLSDAPVWPVVLAPEDALELAVVYVDPEGLELSHTATLELISDDADRPVATFELSAATAAPLSTEADLYIELTWSGGGDLDLHLIKSGGLLFDRPADACFCAPAPDWGTIGARFDDPLLLRDERRSPGREVMLVPAIAPGDYQIAVFHKDDRGNGPAEVTLQVHSRGALLGELSRRVGGDRRYEVGLIDADDFSISFLPSELPLERVVRDACY